MNLENPTRAYHPGLVLGADFGLLDRLDRAGHRQELVAGSLAHYATKITLSLAELM